MLNLAEGTVIELLEQDQDQEITKVSVLSGGQQYQAISFRRFSHIPKPGDRVVLNTTAYDLGLGSGGYHFILYIKSEQKHGPKTKLGHIMKLRYTPLQFPVMSVEEEASPYRSLLERQTSLKGTPVVIGLLHSHLTPAVLAINWKGQGKLKVVYMMTDGGALPIALSQQVAELKSNNLIVGTITIGHAFGGDLEAVNSYSGLLAAKAVLEADIIIVAMGPGIVGTNTQFGFSGAEQGQIANAVAALGGRPVVIPRISFADPRSRHHGLSHHSQTILQRITMVKTWVGLPILPKRQDQALWEQINKAELDKKHILIKKKTASLAGELSKFGFKITTMGRTYEKDPAFFEAAWASGLVAFDLYNSTSEDMNVTTPQ